MQACTLDDYSIVIPRADDNVVFASVPVVVAASRLFGQGFNFDWTIFDAV